jgi:hypothetical protein
LPRIAPPIFFLNLALHGDQTADTHYFLFFLPPPDPKQTEKDDVLPGGLNLPAGTLMCWSQYLMSHVQEFWSGGDVHKFVPERWLTPAPSSIQEGASEQPASSKLQPPFLEHPYQFIPVRQPLASPHVSSLLTPSFWPVSRGKAKVFGRQDGIRRGWIRAVLHSLEIQLRAANRLGDAGLELCYDAGEGYADAGHQTRAVKAIPVGLDVYLGVFFYVSGFIIPSVVTRARLRHPSG